MSASVDCKERTCLACKAKPMRVNPLTPRAFIFSLKYHPWITHKGLWNKTSNNQRLVKCVQSLVRDFLMYWLRRKKNWCFQLKVAKKTFAHEIKAIWATLPASPKWCTMPEITWHHNWSPRDWSIKPSRVISLKTTR